MTLSSRYVYSLKNFVCAKKEKESSPVRVFKVNYQGNHRKSLHLSVEDSLKKLQTSYIDLLYLHMYVLSIQSAVRKRHSLNGVFRWDYSTSIPEIMQALDSLVKAGKVLYLGISDTPGMFLPPTFAFAA